MGERPIADSAPGPETAILPLWLPAFAFAHVFAGYWLIKAAYLINPGWTRSLRACLCPGGRGGAAAGEAAGPTPSENAARANSLDSKVLAELEAAEAECNGAGGARGWAGGWTRGWTARRARRGSRGRGARAAAVRGAGSGRWHGAPAGPHCLPPYHAPANHAPPTHAPHRRPPPIPAPPAPGHGPDHRRGPTAAARLMTSSGGGSPAGGRGAPRSSAGSGRLSVVEVQAVDLEWRRLGCSYRTNQGTKKVLEDVYGLAQPGEMQVGRGAAGRRGEGR
jgi:hypothetical protein